MRPARERRYLVAAGFSVLALSPSFRPSQRHLSTCWVAANRAPPNA